jgi:hypothetical protein
MIDQIDQHLKAWVGQTLPGVVVTLEPPGLAHDGQGASLYLFELVDDPPLRGRQRTPLQAAARFLVTTWAGKTEDAHRLLGDLLFAAMDNPDFQVEIDPLPTTAWTTFGLPPQPSFVLRVPLQLVRPQPAVPRVRHPLDVQPVPLAALHGLVVGPGDVPLADARVMVDGLDALARTDANGVFHLDTLPAGSARRRLRVRAKGQEITLDTRIPSPDDKPVVIRFTSFD